MGESTCDGVDGDPHSNPACLAEWSESRTSRTRSSAYGRAEHQRTVNYESTLLRTTIRGLALSGLLGIASIRAQTAPLPRSGPPEEALVLSTFTVSDRKDVGYESIQTTSGMRTVQELKNVANSISIMNSQLMEDLAATNVEEMSRWFVTGEQSPDPAQQNQLVFRGVRNTFALRNGWIWYSPMDGYATERVEILRGPNAFLYGEADLGGANNQITKRGLFTRNLTRTKVMLGSDDFRRVELDLNRRLDDRLAIRIAAAQSNNNSWIDNVRRDFRGLYVAATYRPLRNTTLSVMAERAKSTAVIAQGLFIENYTYATATALTNSAGVVYLPATGSTYRAAGQLRSNGSGTTAVDRTIASPSLHLAGPTGTSKNYYDSVTLEAEQHVGESLHLLLSGNFYRQQVDNWTAAASRNIYRDLSPRLPDGGPNPNYNRLYSEYYRARNLSGNTVRDIRLSAVYDLRTPWMLQQLAVNLQQHQDNPGQKRPKYGEYVDPANPLWVGSINPALTQAAFTANRAVFANNRFMRRYYFDGTGAAGDTSSLGPIPGLSQYFPDLSNLVPATGNISERRFYIPSVGIGAAGSYFDKHLFTLLGYRRDHFNMKTRVGAPQPVPNTWINADIPGAFSPNPSFANYKVDGSNYGLVYRYNDSLAVSYNRAQSFRISTGEGSDLFTRGAKQGIPTGEGEDISLRLTLFGGRMEFNSTWYKNYQPNSRFNPAPPIAVRDEIGALFPETFNSSGQDYQTLTTSGLEFEIVANLTRHWRLMFNAATNEVVTEKRAPLLRGFQAEAKAANRATPELDAFLLTIPDGVPTAGYTKTRANLFTRYEFSRGPLRGIYIGGGANWREPTFRGNAVLVQGGPAVALWSPTYTVASLLAGYRTKVFGRTTAFSVNVDNVFDKDYYLSATTTTGSWGAPRSFRLTIITDF